VCVSAEKKKRREVRFYYLSLFCALSDNEKQISFDEKEMWITDS